MDTTKQRNDDVSAWGSYWLGLLRAYEAAREPVVVACDGCGADLPEADAVDVAYPDGDGGTLAAAFCPACTAREEGDAETYYADPSTWYVERDGVRYINPDMLAAGFCPAAELA